MVMFSCLLHALLCPDARRQSQACAGATCCDERETRPYIVRCVGFGEKRQVSGVAFGVGLALGMLWYNVGTNGKGKGREQPNK